MKTSGHPQKILSLLFGLTVCMSNMQWLQAKPTNAPSAASPPKRTYGLGLQLQCTERSEAMNKSYDRIKDAAEISYMQRNWDEWQNKHNISYDEIPFARSKGLKIYLALDLLSYDNPRANLLLADKKSGLFSDAKVKADYLALVQEIAARCKPDYFILLVEANLYKDKNPADYEAFKKLYPEAVALVRKYSPATKLGVSITYGDHNGHDGLDAEDDAYFKKCVADFDDNSDMLSVSTYPFFYLNPHALPIDFLNRMASFSKKPLFVSETSWVSEPFDIDLPGGKKFTFKSSPYTQGEYLLKLSQCADYALLQKRKIEAINFVSLNDPKPLSVSVFKLINPKFAWFCSLAVCENSGKPKPAYEFMKAWKAR
ncbi:MAG: glycosyl hydrolase 53 family protein [Candidatus Melainabacteria bacterium]|nr:glycosyl hydrolase 53 family protein [Candidatus Melainabacteria bacterium]